MNLTSVVSVFAKNAVSAIYARSKRDGIVSITFPKSGPRAREVISRSNTKSTGKWPSCKIGRAPHYESANERNAFKLLDACPDVVIYGEQPCEIHYILDGETHHHFPDILVHFKDRKEIWEVKTKSESLDPDVFRRSALMKKHLPSFGYHYQVVLAEELEINPRLKNVEKLLKDGRQYITVLEYEAVRQLFKDKEYIHYNYFDIGALGAKYRKSVLRLILDGVLVIDINQTLEGKAKIHFNTNANGGKSWL